MIEILNYVAFGWHYYTLRCFVVLSPVSIFAVTDAHVTKGPNTTLLFTRKCYCYMDACIFSSSVMGHQSDGRIL